MLHKRKRSDSAISSSPSSSSAFSSPPHPEPSFQFTVETSPSPSPFVYASHFGSAVARQSPAASHLHSRTFKRLRNGRPCEEEVHERTMGMLFAAQRDPQRQIPLNTVESKNLLVNTVVHQEADQSSLHRFWNIHSAPSSTAVPVVSEPQPTTCEDCGAGLGDGNGMDIDGGDGDTCVACAKRVCFGCSVSNLGEEKRCLTCAGTRGDSGWRDGVVVF